MPPGERGSRLERQKDASDTLKGKFVPLKEVMPQNNRRPQKKSCDMNVNFGKFYSPIVPRNVQMNLMADLRY